MSLKLKPKQRLNLKLLRISIACFSVIGICATGVWFFLQTKPEKAFAASRFYSMNDGEWKANNWSKNGTIMCSCDPSCNYNGPGVDISHKITSSVCSPLNISGGGVLNINAGGKLIVTTDMVVSASTVNIYSNDTLIVLGNISITGGSNINNQGGYVRINGNVNLTGGSTYTCSGGTSTYGGSLTFSGGSSWNACSPTFLPIKLIYFKAEAINEDIMLSWATASEENNDYFTIESSTDGKSFNDVIKMNGAGNSNKTLKYSYLDKSQQPGIIYYRLKQTDFNGQYTFSNIEVINYQGNKLAKGETITLKSISPNPFNESFNLNFNFNNKDFSGKTAQLKLFNSTGSIVYDSVIQLKAGNNNYQFMDNHNLAKGIYFLNLYCDGEMDTRQIIKE